MPLFERGLRRVHSDEGRNDSEEADEKSTETGDAYWYWAPIGVDPIPLEKGLSDIVSLAEQRTAVEGALDSFGTPYSPSLRSAMRAAWHEIMDAPPRGSARDTGRPTDKR